MWPRPYRSCVCITRRVLAGYVLGCHISLYNWVWDDWDQVPKQHPHAHHTHVHPSMHTI